MVAHQLRYEPIAYGQGNMFLRSRTKLLDPESSSAIIVADAA
jgi:hypothetical protein